ncbi:hypothetical protein [Salinibacter altiplanensis]|uniref:hypothetical protein n=1 Tax=Salinibacter altiplanensis TaxID=1803181 RepID=UPI0018F8989A|nr:hypothetical protein [Salinibacter altiplanensis]
MTTTHAQLGLSMHSLGYPFVFEHTNCGERATIGQSGAANLNHDPDSTDAAAHGFGVGRRDWLREEGQLLYPDCAED